MPYETTFPSPTQDHGCDSLPVSMIGGRTIWKLRKLCGLPARAGARLCPYGCSPRPQACAAQRNQLLPPSFSLGHWCCPLRVPMFSHVETTHLFSCGSVVMWNEPHPGVRGLGFQTPWKSPTGFSLGLFPQPHER